jgi:hypothetical protein
MTSTAKSDSASKKADTKASTSPRPVTRTPPGRKPTVTKWVAGEGDVFRVEYTCEICGMKDAHNARSYNPRVFCCRCKSQMIVSVAELSDGR